jgi:methionyl-tRNA formyltransferase
MFDCIILLTGPTELPVLSAALKGHRPDLSIVQAPSSEALLAIDAATLARSRLVGFATPVIVPRSVLDRLGYGAFNFHPGPPHYPGLCPAQFAVYDGARRFGVTAHLMVERVDEGPIFDVISFDVPECAGVLEIETRSYRELARLFWRNAARLARDATAPEALSVRWSGPKTTRSRYRELATVSPEIEAGELERRVRAFGGNYFGMPLTVTLHGKAFAYAAPEPATPKPGTGPRS